MYKPTNAKQLLTDCTKLLISLEDKLDVTHGFDEILLLDELIKMYPNISVKEHIIGPKYKDFIVEMYKRYNPTSEYKDELPYMPYNIRSGVYSSIIGLMGEYISYATCLENYQEVKLLQDNTNQLQGNDIEYYHNDHYITADVKVSATDWSQEATIKCHPEWFAPHKKSTRFHIVDICNGMHFVIGRSFLHYQFERHGRIIPTSAMSKYGVYTQSNISHIVQSFLK